MKKISIYLAALAILSSACTRDDDAHRFGNVIYFAGAGRVADVRVAEDDASLSRNLSVEMAIPESRDISVSLKVDPGKLERYRSEFEDPGAVLLPEANFALSSEKLVLSSGSVSSLPVNIVFNGVNSLPDLATHYVLPLTISSADVSVLGSASTLYYVLSKASLVNVVADITDNRCWPEWKDPEPFRDMPAFTMEALVNATTFKRNDDKGNKIASPLATVMGIEDRFLIRVGDTMIPDNQIQVAYAQQDGEGSTKRGNVSNSAMQIKPGQWYHIAVTFENGAISVYVNGKLLGSGDSSEIGVTTVDFSTEHSEEDEGKPRCFWIGYSYDSMRYWNGRICEARIWNRALSGGEINAVNHFYQVDPDSAGLIAYWKFDDGEGAVVKDYSPLGNNLFSQLPLSWYSAALPEE